MKNKALNMLKEPLLQFLADRSDLFSDAAYARLRERYNVTVAQPKPPAAAMAASAATETTTQ